MYRFIMCCLLQVLAWNSRAQQGYPAAHIPAGLRPFANAVVRLQQTVFEVKNKTEAVETRHSVVTLLNHAAREFATPSFPYSNFENIESIDAAVYDAMGKQVYSLKKKDILDQKPGQYYVDDIRYKVLDLPAGAYPYTVEYSVRIRHNGLMFYTPFMPQYDPQTAVESAEFEVILPEGMQVRHLALHMPENSRKAPLKWAVQHLKAFEPEPFAPPAEQLLPRVLFAPKTFSFGGFDGDMEQWSSYGMFLQHLNETQQSLPSKTADQLKALVADCGADARCKAIKVYDYLQANTRYFFVGLGIGGWQPAPAEKVDAYKYGDCKGLSNYYVSMLKAAGVPAYYALIKAGRDAAEDQYPDFPNPYFNHVIACVPLGADTLWMECTSQTETPGFLSDFTDNRPALLVSEQGGRLVHTPVYTEAHNRMLHQIGVQLSTDGSAQLSIHSVYSGITQSLPAYLSELHDTERKKYLYETLRIPDFEIKTLDMQRLKSDIPEVRQTLELTAGRMGTLSGKRMFVGLPLLTRAPEAPPADSLRQYPVQAVSRSQTEETRLSLNIPEGYVVEQLPENQIFKCSFGEYSIAFTQNDSTIQVHRTLLLWQKTAPSTEYEALRNFLKAIARNDRAKLVFVKQ